MTAPGQSRSFGDVASMSELPSRAVVERTSVHGSNVPQAVIGQEIADISRVSSAEQAEKLEKGDASARDCGEDRNRFDEPISLNRCNPPLRSFL